MTLNPPIVFGVPRSGSTFIFNIIDKLFEDVGGVDSQVHTLDIKDKSLLNNKVIATYRDFRNCIVSYRKLQHTNTKLIYIYYKILNSLTCLEYLKELSNDKVLFLKYEDFFQNFDYIFEKLEDFYNYEFSSEKKEWIIENFNIENGNNNLHKVMKGFNKHHIQNGGKTNWKDYEDWNLLNLEGYPVDIKTKLDFTAALKYHLKLWEYEV